MEYDQTQSGSSWQGLIFHKLLFNDNPSNRVLLRHLLLYCVQISVWKTPR